MTRRLAPWLGLALVLVLASGSYYPGLSGGFLFDDFVNLNALGATGPVDNWPTFWRYITSGNADPTGRPLSLLTFLIDARDWPADPSVFLRNNLILHLLNGVLLFSLFRRLGKFLDSEEQQGDAIAILAAGLWLLHPLLVSTTLYAVQREAMLPATFTLLGLLVYLHGRLQFGQSGGTRGALWMVAGIGAGTTLAFASKGNGILLPLLAWVLDATVLNRANAAIVDPRAVNKIRKLKLLFLILPSLMVFAYLASNLRSINVDLPNRPWTVGQRLLTEPRVLLDYLQLLFVPRSVSTGLYNDAYVVSASPWHPISTLPSLAVVLGLIYTGLRLRHRAPRLSAAVLFFFAGHLLESTTIPLELYFEHRNYLPAMLLFWPIAHGLFAWKRATRLRWVLAAAMLVLFAVTTHQRATLWGHPEKLAKLWALQNPESSRAQATEGIWLTGRGEYQAAVLKLGPLWRNKPTDLQLAFNYINAACRWRGLGPAEKAALAAALGTTTNGGLIIHNWLGNAVDTAASGACPGMALSDVDSWILAAARNPVISPPQIRDQTIEPLLARMAIARHQPERALEHFNRGLAASIKPDIAAISASLLASAGHFHQARAHLDYYDRIKPPTRAPAANMSWVHHKVLEWQGYWPREMAILRRKLAVEIARQKEGSPAETDERL